MLSAFSPRDVFCRLGAADAVGGIATFLGLVLCLAGVLQGNDLFFAAGDASPLAMLLAEFELALGLALVVGFRPQQTRLVAMVCFAGFLLVSLYRACAGACSCGCFSKLVIHPWWTALFNAGALAALWRWRPVENEPPLVRVRPWRFAGLLVLLAVGAATVFSLQPRRVSLQGSVAAENGPLPLATVLFWDESGAKVGGRTDSDGRFHLDAIKPGTYRVTVSRVWLRPEVTWNNLLQSQDHPGPILQESVPAAYTVAKATPLRAQVKPCGNEAVEIHVEGLQVQATEVQP